MLTISMSGKNLKIEFDKSDRERLNDIVGKIPIYKIDEDFDEVLAYYELPKSHLKDILAQWSVDEIKITEKAFPFYNKYVQEITKIDDLESIKEELNYLRKPREFQRKYITINRSKTKLIAALDTGAGKTLSSLERARLLERDKEFNLLIICPKTCMANWQAEVRLTYDKPSFIFWAIGETKREELKKELPKHKIVITSYQMAKHFDFKADQIIIDEAHLIKNEKTDRYKGCNHHICAKSGLQLLTGTPIYNRVRDLYPLIKLVSPNAVGSKGAFLRKYESHIGVIKIKKTLANGQEIMFPVPKLIENKNLDQLYENCKAFLYRVDGNDIREYEDVIDHIEVNMTPKQSKIYKHFANEFISKIEDNELDPGDVLRYYTKLRQLSEGIFDANTIESGKFDYACERIDELDEEDSIVIWSCFQPSTNAMYEKYKDRAVLFNGSVSDSRKKLAIWSFQGVVTEEEEKEFWRLRYLPSNKDWKFGPGEAKVFSGVINAISSIGVNLQKASKQIIMQYDLTQTANLQASARIRRIGQKAEYVNTAYLLSAGTNDRVRLEKQLRNNLNNINVIDGKSSISYLQQKEILKEIRDSL